jgi:beta-phosphoglucomutase-like phosphatase (HAD superfamily)
VTGFFIFQSLKWYYSVKLFVMLLPMPTPKITTFIFDCFGVLCANDPAVTHNAELGEIIGKLKAAGYKTALLSNAGAAFLDEKISKHNPEYKNLFDEIVLSAEVGMVKPEPGIFRHTLEMLLSKPEESLFIDDSTGNVEAAMALKINGYVFTDSASFASYLQEIGIHI